jgi:hypothetical protein
VSPITHLIAVSDLGAGIASGGNAIAFAEPA